MKITRQGEVYYENHITKTTSWERPPPPQQVQVVPVHVMPAQTISIQAVPLVQTPVAASVGHSTPPDPPGESLSSMLRMMGR